MIDETNTCPPPPPPRGRTANEVRRVGVGARFNRTLLLVATIVGTTATSVAAESTGDPRLDAFRDVCFPVRHDHQAMKRLAGEQGWRPVDDNHHPSLGRLLAITREAMKPEPGEDISGDAVPFVREREGHAYYLVLTTVAVQGIALNGCYLYDFAADAPVDPAVVTRWVGEQQVETIEQPEVVQGRTWNGTRFPGTLDIRSGYIPRGSVLFTKVGFVGLALSTTAGAGQAP